jgi:hypothetical protein
MGFLDKLKFNLWDDVGAVTTLIGNWQPESCKSEKDFENSLYKFLHAELGDTQITKQFAQGRIRADLAIGTKVIVELKFNLNTTTKYQRLIGQLDSYKGWEGRVIVLLVGETEPNLFKELVAWTKKGGFFDLEGKISVFQK